MVDHINNGEQGLSVREKLNTVIDRTNDLMGIEDQVEANKDLSQQNKDKIDSLSEEVKDLDVSVLDGKIDKEIQDRIDGDANLQGQIDGLADVDEGLQGQIDAIVAELGEGGTGAGMVISPTEPPAEDRVEGMQWLDSTTADVWIWDGEKWLEFPVKGVKGDPGEKGADGTNGIDGTNGTNGTDGADGEGFTGGSYDAGTGVVTFTSDDGLGFSTGDLRGADGAPGSADMPPYSYDFTPDTLVLRNGSGDIKGKKVIGQQLQMTTGGTTPSARPGDTIFYSSVSNQIFKNTAEGMRAALGITGEHETANKGEDYRYELDQISENIASRPGKMNLNNANPESVTRISFYVTDADSRPMPHVSEGYFVEFSHDDGDVLYKVIGADNAQYMIVEWVSGDMVFQETVTYQANVYPLLSSLWNGDDFMITGTYHSKEGNFVGDSFGLRFDSDSNSVVPIASNGNPKVGIDLGSTAAKFKDGDFTGEVRATAFVGDGSQLTGVGGGGLPDGGYTYGGTITATDFIATSDRREKKNIVTAPVGVIDQIRGVEYEWKTSGQMGSGVIAQELEDIPELAHLVHESDGGTKHVSYLGLIGYLIEEVKALRKELDSIK